MPLVPLKIQKAKRRERGKLWQRLREDTRKEVWMVVGGIIPQVTTQMNIKNKIKVKTCILKDDRSDMNVWSFVIDPRSLSLGSFFW